MFVYTEFTKKKSFGQLTLAVASLVRRHHGRQKVSIPECEQTGRRSTMTLLPIRFSMLMFMCRDPGDTTSKVPRCVQPSYCFRNSDFDASVRVPLKISLPENKTKVNLKNASFVIITLLHEGLTHIHSQIKPGLLFGESFTLNQSTLNNQKIFFSPETMIRIVFGKTYVWSHPHSNLKPYSYSPCGRGFILTLYLVPDCSYLTTSLFSSKWVFLFCGSPWNQILWRGNVTLFFGKVNSYPIQKQSPDFTSMVVVVTVMENSLSFKVSAKESKITFPFKVQCGM